MATARASIVPEFSKTALSDFAPIVYGRGGMASMAGFMNATRESVMNVAYLQADALDPVFKALADDLNVDRPRGMKTFTAGDLKEIFLTHAERMQFVQMQTPMLVEAGRSRRVSDHIRNHDHIEYAQMFGPFDDETMVAGDMTSVFQNLSLVRNAGDQRTLIGVPVAGIDPWILRMMGDLGQRPALEAMQRTIARVCHDYYHHLTPVGDEVYFGAGLINPGVVPDDMRESYYRTDLDAGQGWEDGLKIALADLDSEFAGDNSSEPHAFLTHKRVFARLWEDETFRDDAFKDIDIFLDGVQAMKPHFYPDGYDTLYFGALTTMGAYLLRAAGPGHALMTRFMDGIDGRFNLSGERARDILGEYLEDDDLAGMDMPGDIVLWNAQRMADESYGVIHTRRMSRLNAESRAKAQDEMNRARKACNVWAMQP